MIRIPRTHRELYDEEVVSAVEYVSKRPYLGSLLADVEDLRKRAQAAGPGDLTIPVTGGLAVVALGCIQVAGSLIQEATQQGSGPQARMQIRQSMSTLCFWCAVAEQAETETGTILPSGA